MNLHFQILLWLSIIFIVAGAIILAIMLKTKRREKRILFRFYGYFLNFRLCNAHLYIYFWYIINFNFTFMNKNFYRTVLMY